jgi:hypothetical protein
MAQRQRRTRNQKRKAALQQNPPVFGELNYKYMAGGGGLVLLGLTLMTMFNSIDGFIPLYVSPLMMIAGFILFGYGIIKKNPALTPDSPGR